jgi:hypothetical protein
MRLTVMTIAVLLAVTAGWHSAWAATAADITLLKTYFQGLGEVQYDSYAPLSSPDQPVGGAVIAAGGSGTLHIARIENGRATELMSVPLPEIGRRPPFTFLLTGMHLMVYPTREWTDADGLAHQRGDMQIFSLVGPAGHCRPRICCPSPRGTSSTASACCRSSTTTAGCASTRKQTSTSCSSI